MESIDHWAARVRELEAAIATARARALAEPPSAAFFAFFTSQKAAAIAAQANLHPEDGHSFPRRGGARARGGALGSRALARRFGALPSGAPALARQRAGWHQAPACRAQVNWQTLWMSWTERDWREVLVMPLIVGIMLVPVGIFSGAAPADPPLAKLQTPAARS